MTHEEQKKELTPVQKKFAKEYALDFNGAAAYMRASGTSNKKSAGVQACKLLKMPKVQEAYKMFVTEQLGPLEKHLIGNVQFWIDIRDNTLEVEMISRSEVLDILVLVNTPEATLKKIRDLKLCPIPSNPVTVRLKASEHLAKWEQMFVDKKEVSIEAAVTIVDNIPND